MENRENQIVKDFFEKNKGEIVDNGFSSNVMQRLPQQTRSLDWIVPLFAAAVGIIFTLFIVDFNRLTTSIFCFVRQMSLIYFLTVVFFIPFATLGIWFGIEKRFFYL